MLWISLALAQSPLRVERMALDLPNASLLADSAPADGVPDGWIEQEATGSLKVEASRDRDANPIARLVWTPGTKASLCSAAVAVTPGTTLRLSTRVRGEPTLDDVTALHLHIGGGSGTLHTAKRRFDTGDFPWQEVEILATVPAGATTAFACFQVQMVRDSAAAGFQVEPLRFEQIVASSNLVSLPYKRVVLVTVETFRRDHVRAYGYPRATTPNLDALIAEGASFDRHYVQAPYTHPSLAALVTGQFPTTLGFIDNIPTIGASAPTIAELMSQAGYVTAAFNVQYVLSNRYGLNRGFHYYRNHPNDTPANVLNDELIP
ncbi:MAG: sulfatase-like hydrolase/transferase, partial [Deltaproteobacteria bacterium]|nr:sulfatase-like hydrolase/transferase [Deltaproteobacteria bacterium]